MKSAAEQLAFYEAYHKNPINKLTHFVGIPLIMYAVLLAFSWIQVPVGEFTLTGGMVLAAVVLAYYALLDATLALGMLVAVAPLLYLAHVSALLPWGPAAGLFLGAFILGWILQLIGHSVFEKRRPAFTQNLFQLIIGPLFLVAEVYFLCGVKRELRGRIKELESRLPPTGQIAG